MRLRRTLRKCAEADGVCGRSQLLPFRRPFEVIPGATGREFKGRLSHRIDIYFRRTRGMLRVDLEEFAAEADAFEATSSGAAERVAADAAGDDAVIAEKAGHVGEIGGCAAEFFPFGENVPEEFAEADDVVGLMRHGLGSR